MDWSSFAQRFPLLTHVTSGTAATTSEKTGLLSASQLITEVGNPDGLLAVRWLGPTSNLDSQQVWRIQGAEETVRALRFRHWEKELWGDYSTDQHHRACRVAIRSPRDPDDTVRAVLGNHYPLGGNRKTIEEVLLGISLGEWIAILNNMLFMFPGRTTQMNKFRERVRSQVSAQAVIHIDTKRVPETARRRLRLSAINGGSINGMARRGATTYAPLAKWKPSETPKELAFEDGLTADEVSACIADVRPS